MTMSDLAVHVSYRLEANRIAFHLDKKTLRMAEAFSLKTFVEVFNKLKTWEVHGDLLVLKGAEGPLCVLEKIR